MTGAAKVSPEFREFLVNATALAALGTIADVVPLQGENRVLAQFGLERPAQHTIERSACPDRVGGSDRPKSRQLSRRIPACASLMPAAHGARTPSQSKCSLRPARKRRRKLPSISISRIGHGKRSNGRFSMKRSSRLTKNGWDGDGQRALVLGAENWHPGVIGIVASRIVERFHRPTVMLAINNGHAQGSPLDLGIPSCTGIGGLHRLLGNARRTRDGRRIEVGNHPPRRIPYSVLRSHAGECLTEEMLVPQIKIDAVGELKEITLGLMRRLARLAPFGHGNRRPLFVCRSVSVVSPPRRVGKTSQHLQMQVRQADQCMKCIASARAILPEKLPPGTVIDMAVEPCLNEYNGRTSVELEVKDLQLV